MKKISMLLISFVAVALWYGWMIAKAEDTQVDTWSVCYTNLVKCRVKAVTFKTNKALKFELPVPVPPGANANPEEWHVYALTQPALSDETACYVAGTPYAWNGSECTSSDSSEPTPTNTSMSPTVVPTIQPTIVPTVQPTPNVLPYKYYFPLIDMTGCELRNVPIPSEDDVDQGSDWLDLCPNQSLMQAINNAVQVAASNQSQ